MKSHGNEILFVKENEGITYMNAAVKFVPVFFLFTHKTFKFFQHVKCREYIAGNEDFHRSISSYLYLLVIQITLDTNKNNFKYVLIASEIKA